MTFITNSPEETFELGYKVGKILKVGDVVTLDGDLGAGKTLFTKGIGKALQISEPITSPTFAILNIYTTGYTPLFHFDAYRISSYEELLDIGYEEYNNGIGVIVIEWAKNIEDLPLDKLVKIEIERMQQKPESMRKITINTVEGKEKLC